MICAYDDPDGFERYKEQQNSLSGDTPAEKSEEDSTHEKESAWGSSIVAIDQSAMTGESLAVSSFAVRQYTKIVKYLQYRARLTSTWARYVITQQAANAARHMPS